MTKIHSDLVKMAVPISSLHHLEGIPRLGDDAAIKTSLEEFGQLKPIVIFDNQDDTYTIIAGNHTVYAAKELGWEEIAAVIETEMDIKKATAFALIDNQVSEMGHTDTELLTEMIIDVSDVYPNVFEGVGWDDFEIAAMYTDHSQQDFEGALPTGQAGGYVAPVIISEPAKPSVIPVASDDEEDGPRLVAPVGTDERAAVVSGVGGAVSQSDASKKASIQYTLIFDDADQMSRWWEFIKFLRSSPVYEGETITAKLMDFIESHGEF